VATPGGRARGRLTVSSSVSESRRREVLRQASVALERRLVILWEIAPSLEAVPILTSVPDPAHHETKLDLDATLRGWRVTIVPGSRWVGCCWDEGGRWCVAPVRAEPAAPPPRGVERRSRERMVLELTGLCTGVIDRSPIPTHSRLPEAEALLELARRPSVIAHEVASPLTAALASAELCRDLLGDEQGSDQRLRPLVLEELENVTEGMERAVRYLRAIQDRARGAPARLERFDAAEVVRSCVTLERPLARKRGVVLQEEIATSPVFLQGDPNALYRILVNLIRNAVAASHGGNLPVWIRLERDGDMLHLVVRDQGTGVPPEHLERIFEPGFTTKPVGEGWGIGLCVVRDLAQEVFRGDVSVASTLGRGTVLTVALPVPPQRGVCAS
jgi:two-component system, NtrC family, sensor kinase